MRESLIVDAAGDVPGQIADHIGRSMAAERQRVVAEAVTSGTEVDLVLREQAGLGASAFGLSGAVASAAAALPADLRVWVSRHSSQGHARATALLARLGATVCDKPEAGALCIVTPYGQDVSTSVVQQGLSGECTVGLDTLYELEPGRRRTLMLSPATQPAWRDTARALLASDGAPVSVIGDSTGFVAQRIVAHIVNMACDIAQQGISTPEGIDHAVMRGLGYATGPLALGDAFGAHRIMEILVNMQRVTGNMRYRPSLWLQRRVQLGMALMSPAAA